MTSIRRVGAVLLAVAIIAGLSSLITWSVTSTTTTSPVSAVPECRQAQLQVAMEQRGGGGSVTIPLGYTFLIVNISGQTCDVRGYPYEVLFSTTTGVPVKVTISHRPNILYLQPRPRRVVLRPGGVASFGLSYADDNVAPPSQPTACIATLVDFRLPARLSALYSFEFLLRPIDFCQTARQVDVTPLEFGPTPLAQG